MARRAQERCLRRRWNHGQLVIRETYPRERPWCLLVFLSLTVAAFVLSLRSMLPGLRRALEEAGSLPLPASYPVLLILAAVLYLAIILALLLAFVWISMSRRKVNVASAQFDGHGLRARLLDGSQIEFRWDQLRRIQPSCGIAWFECYDGTTLWLPCQRRTRFIVDLLTAKLHPESITSSRRAERNVVVRIGVYMLAGTLLAGLGAWHLLEHYHIPVSPARTITGIAGILLTITLVVVVSLWMSDDLRHRKRGRK